LAGLGTTLAHGWIQKPPPPPNPVTCLGSDRGGCEQEQNSVYLYTDNPKYPTAIAVEYSSTPSGDGTDESITVGADVPAHHRLHWMVELLGAARLEGEQFRPGGKPSISLGPHVRLRTMRAKTIDSGNSVQALEGWIQGPSDEFDIVKGAATSVPNDNGDQYAEGMSEQRLATWNSSYLEADLPFVRAVESDEIPGSPAVPPRTDDNPFVLPGKWYYPRTGYASEWYNLPLGATIGYASPPVSSAGSAVWTSNHVAYGYFGAELPGYADNESIRTFKAGIALGIAGSAVIAALQAFATIPLRRRRRWTRR